MDPSSGHKSAGDDLQFEHVEEAQPAPESGPNCTACHRPIQDVYYEVNRKLLCPGCRDLILAALTGGPRWQRFLRAAVFGALAAIVAAVIWGAVRHFTGYEVGIIAIVVGLLVGGAVRRGSRGCGGWVYQLLAVGLTYSAIGLTFLPVVVQGMMNRDEGPALLEQTDPQAQEATTAPATVTDRVAGTAAHPTTMPAAPLVAPAGGRAGTQPAMVSTTQPAGVARAVATTAPAKAKTRAGRRPAQTAFHSAGTGGKIAIFLLGVVFLITVALAVPLLLAVQGGDIIWAIIVLIALHQAWRLNKRAQLVVNGPYQVGSLAAANDEGATGG